MQATVFSFDQPTGTGTVVTDEGARYAFDAAVFERSGLRLLRPGQRVRVAIDSDIITSLAILTMPAASTPPQT